MAALLIAGGAAGCTSTSKTVTPTSTTTVTVPASSPSSAPSDSGPTSPSSAPASSPALISECTTPNLAGSITAGGGAAGTIYTNIVLTTHGSLSCALQGWPGVSWVGGGNGTQIGPGAVLDRTTVHSTVTLAPGAAVKAVLAISGYNDDMCDPKPADGLRVYPPGQGASVFIKDTLQQACSGVEGLKVGALH